MDDSSEGSILSGSRSPPLAGDRDGAFQRRLDKGKDALAAYLLSRQVSHAPRSAALGEKLPHRGGNPPRSAFLRAPRLSDGSEDDGLAVMDFLSRPQSARGGVGGYGGGRGDDLVKRLAGLEGHCEALERALRDKSEEADLAQQQGLRVRREREEVMELFEGAMERVRQLEGALEAQKRSAEDVVADTDEQNEELRTQVRMWRERCRDWEGAQGRLEGQLEETSGELEKLDEIALKQSQLIVELRRELQAAEAEIERLGSASQPPEEMEGGSWEEVCASLKEELAGEKTRVAGLVHEKGVHHIDAQFKDKEMEALRAKVARLEKACDEAEAAKEESVKEAEVLKEQVDLLKTTMESRLKDIVKDIKGELSGSKELVEHLQARLGVEQAKMDGRTKQLDDRIQAFNTEEKALQRKISARDEILQYTLQRLVKMAESTSEEKDGRSAAWDAEVRALREQLALQSAKELAGDSSRKRSWASGNNEDLSAPSDSSVGSSYDSASQAAIFQGEEGTMIATSAMQMCRKKRRRVSEDGGAEGGDKPQRTASGSWLGRIFGAGGAPAH